mgnify:CR=1 FL=1
MGWHDLVARVAPRGLKRPLNVHVVVLVVLVVVVVGTMLAFDEEKELA